MSLGSRTTTGSSIMRPRHRWHIRRSLRWLTCRCPENDSVCGFCSDDVNVERGRLAIAAQPGDNAMAMPKTGSEGPPRWLKRAVTIAIGLHFLAIWSTVVGTSTFRYQAPPLVEMLRVSPPVNFYLQSTFLTNPYRFYAPDPGPTSLMWFRLKYADDTVRWFELARRDDFALRIPYQRHMSIAMMLFGMGVAPDPTDPGKLVILPEAQIGLSSYVRHVAGMHPRTAPDGTAIPVELVSVYAVFHNILEPDQIRLGWEPDALQLYEMDFLGQY